MQIKDEMEQKISYKSIKITWFVTVIILFIIGLIQGFRTDNGTNIFSIIASISAISPFVLERYYLAKINEDNTFIKFIGLVIILTAIFLLIVWWAGSW
jgi:hypothetical protein